MFDKFKQTLNQTVSSTKFKADQLIKINNIQTEIAGIQRDAGGVREQIANMVVELHQRGALPVPELEPLCAQLEGLLAQIMEKTHMIEAIKAEPVPGQAPQPQVPPQQYPQPGYPQQGYPQQQPYPPQQPPAPAPYPPAPAPMAGTKSCPNCQATVPAAVMFCPNCGFNFPPAAEAAPAPAAKTTKTCANCQFEAPLTSAFCPNCGKPLNG
jgi:RNA polymerase subunit RPABC4/transcription elongation factor Spt4